MNFEYLFEYIIYIYFLIKDSMNNRSEMKESYFKNYYYGVIIDKFIVYG